MSFGIQMNLLFISSVRTLCFTAGALLRADGPVMMSRNSIHSTSALKQITKALFLVLGSCRQQEERMINEMETNCVKLSAFLDLKLHSAFISLTMVQLTCYRHALWFQLQLLKTMQWINPLRSAVNCLPVLEEDTYNTVIYCI